MKLRLWWLVAVLGTSLTVSGCTSEEDSSSSVATNLNAAAAEQLGFAIASEPTRPARVNFTDDAGKPLTLEAFKGKVVLLNLWATWCPPCREEMPTLDALQAELGGPDFEVIALSIDQDGPGVVQSFYDEIGIKDLRVYNDEKAQAGVTLGALGVPVTLLLNRDGYEVARLTGPKDWHSPGMVELLRNAINAAPEGGTSTDASQ
jgi:thiol-disulfide isomerase/thioredoxin